MSLWPWSSEPIVGASGEPSAGASGGPSRSFCMTGLGASTGAFMGGGGTNGGSSGASDCQSSATEHANVGGEDGGGGTFERGCAQEYAVNWHPSCAQEKPVGDDHVVLSTTHASRPGGGLTLQANSSRPGGLQPNSSRPGGSVEAPGELLRMPVLLGGCELPAEVLRDFAVEPTSPTRKSWTKAGLVGSCSSPALTNILELKGMVSGSSERGPGTTDVVSLSMAMGQWSIERGGCSKPRRGTPVGERF